MEGCGNRAEISIDGGVGESVVGVAKESFFLLLKSELRFFCPGVRGWKEKGRRAKASWPVMGGRGGSMGRNLKPSW